MTTSQNRRTRSKFGRLAALGAAMMLLPLAVGEPAAAAAATVTSSADSGPGTLRAAVEAANTNRSITKINVKPGLGPIALVNTGVVYSGTQNLVIDGNGATISGAPSSLLSFETAGNITLQEMNLDGGSATAVSVEIPSTAPARSMRIRFINMDIANLSNGIDIVDQRASGSVYVISRRLDVDAFFTGINIVESGPGNVSFNHRTGSLAGTSAVVVAESGPGSAIVTLFGADIITNFAGPATGSPLQVAEADGGDLRLNVTNVDFDAQVSAQTIRATERGAGHLIANLTNVTHDVPMLTGMQFEENDAGNVRVRTRNVDTSGSGVSIKENGVGTVDAIVSRLIAPGAPGTALTVAQEAPGRGRLRLDNSDLRNAGTASLELAGIERFVDFRNLLDPVGPVAQDPEVNFVTPAPGGENFDEGETLVLDFSCSDPDGIIASCSAVIVSGGAQTTVTEGQDLTGALVGTYTLRVTAISSDGGITVAEVPFVINAVDNDPDGDGVDNPNDNCPSVPNAGQENRYGAADGDACEDLDGDGTADVDEADFCLSINGVTVEQRGAAVCTNNSFITNTVVVVNGASQGSVGNTDGSRITLIGDGNFASTGDGSRNVIRIEGDNNGASVSWNDNAVNIVGNDNDVKISFLTTAQANGNTANVNGNNGSVQINYADDNTGTSNGGCEVRIEGTSNSDLATGQNVTCP